MLLSEEELDACTSDFPIPDFPRRSTNAGTAIFAR